jgi:hypothetical protein
MSKWSAVVAAVVLLLTGAIGFRNIVSAHAVTVSALNGSSAASWARVGGPIPPLPPGGGHVMARVGGPIPPLPPGGGHVMARVGGPIPPLPPGGGHVMARVGGPIPPLPPGGGH